jgi:hypothetical protein
LTNPHAVIVCSILPAFARKPPPAASSHQVTVVWQRDHAEAWRGLFLPEIPIFVIPHENKIFPLTDLS